MTMKRDQAVYVNQTVKSRAHYSNQKRALYEHDEENISLPELKKENQKLRKLLKEAQSKRTQITKECSNLNRMLQKRQDQNNDLKSQVRQEQEKCDGQKYRWEQLKYLNKQLSSEIEQLRAENDSVTQKLRYSSQILQRKYEQLQQKTYKRMEQSVKRIKKSIHYLQNLSPKQIDKTRSMLIDNLRKGIELLRGKYNEQLDCEVEIQELMNPLKTIQEENVLKSKELNHYKQQNLRLLQDLSKYKKMEKQQIPMFKEGMQRLKKNLAQVRSQLSENQYQKMQGKKKYEQKIKQIEYKYNQLFKQCRKLKLQNKIYQNKLEQLEADNQEEKERLLGENMMLKKLYNTNNDVSQSRISRESQQSKDSNYHKNIYREKNDDYMNTKQKQAPNNDKRTQEKRMLKKNFSSNELKTSHNRMKQSYSEYEIEERVGEVSQYNEQTSVLSQQNLKNEICRIDQQIMEIQKNLTKQLQAYR